MESDSTRTPAPLGGEQPATPRGMQPPDRRPVRITVPEGRHLPRYGDPFFPKVPFQAIFYISAIFGMLIFLAIASPAPLQDPADPLNHAAIDPKPEWYFMFLFQLLKYFPGMWVPVGTVVIPTIAVLLLLLLPFYDRNWARKVEKRPIAVLSMTAGMLAIFVLTWGGFGFPKPDFSTTSTVATPPSSGGGTTASPSISPQVAAIFSAHCAQCHINIVSGGLSLKSYPDLVAGGTAVKGAVVIPGNHTKSILWQVLQPGTGQPGGARMPLGGPYLSASDQSVIASWIDGLGKTGGATTKGGAGTPPSKPVSFKTDIQSIFTAHCAACHISAVSGGVDLKSYQSVMAGSPQVPGKAIVKPGAHAGSVLWQVLQPGSSQPGGARMPFGGPYLSSDQISSIAAWIDQGAKNN